MLLEKILTTVLPEKAEEEDIKEVSLYISCLYEDGSQSKDIFTHIDFS